MGLSQLHFSSLYLSIIVKSNMYQEVDVKVQHVHKRQCFFFAFKLRASLNSFGGVLGHYRSYHLRSRLWSEYSLPLERFGSFDSNMLKFHLQ